MPWSRRRFLTRGAGALALSPVLPGCLLSSAETSELDAYPPFNEEPFAHGVASGDPLPDRVILWTRLSGVQELSTEVHWIVARDSSLRDVVAEGTSDAKLVNDYTVKVDVTGLEPGTSYYYAFETDLAQSAVGRTRTLAAQPVEQARIAVTSCANYAHGYFHAYRAIADLPDIDLWIHLGDYVYEYGEVQSSLDRPLEPKGETLTLQDYRRRYAHYRRDPDLQAIHHQHPLVAIWDDHEIANNAYMDGAENHSETNEGSYQDRKIAAARAFVEWMPIRVAGRDGDVPQIYRTFRCGDLFDLIMLDTRLSGRSKQATGGAGRQGTEDQWEDERRRLISEKQTTWLLGELSGSSRRATSWRLIGNQVFFTPVRDPRTQSIYRADSWDGYRASRERVQAHIQKEGIDNIVFLTGDIHTSWAMEVSADPFSPSVYDRTSGRGAYAVELATPAISSDALDLGEAAKTLAMGLKRDNPHLKWLETENKGYVLLDVTHERIHAEWHFVENVKRRDGGRVTVAAALECGSGSARLETVSPAGD